MSDTDELQPLYLAIGYVITKWSFIDAALDFTASTIYVDCGAQDHQRPQVRRANGSFRCKAKSLKFTASAAQASQHLASLSALAMPVISTAGTPLKRFLRAFKLRRLSAL